MKFPTRHHVAALALAVVLPVGAGLLAADPALLAGTADGGQPSSGGIEPSFIGDPNFCGDLCFTPDTTPATDPTGFSMTVERAKIEAKRRLETNTTCAFLITGPQPRKGRSAVQAADDAITRDATGETLPGKPNALAQTELNSVVVNGEFRDQIRYFKPFIDNLGRIDEYIDTTKIRVALPPDRAAEILRAFAVLHEVGHVTGAHGQHTDTDPGIEFNTRIMVACFGEFTTVISQPVRISPSGPRNTLPQIENLN